MKGFNIAPPGSTGSLAPVAEFSTSLDNFEQQHDILSSTLSNLFTPTFMQKKATFSAGDSFNSMESPPPSLISTVNTVQSANKYNKSTLKPYNKRIAGHKKKWGTLIEAAKVGNVSKMLGRSKSEDSVCNSSTVSSPVHGQVRVTYSQNGQSYYNSNSNDSPATTTHGYNTPSSAVTPHIRKDHLKPLNVNGPLGVPGVTAGSAGGTHFFHTPTGKLSIYVNCKE